MKVGVLFVSTGGICRSPLAAGVLRTFSGRGGLEKNFDIAIAATFDGHAGDPPSLLAIEVAAARGYDIHAFRARPLQSEDIVRYDHVMAMDRDVLAAVRWAAPGGFVDRPQLLMRYAPGNMGNDITDPFGGTRDDYERTLDLIERGCAGLMMEIVQGSGQHRLDS